jgi:hypothetical protein
MSAWWGEYCKQIRPGFDRQHYPEQALQWDTFTMWRLLTYGNMGVKTGRFPDPDARWNFVIGYKEEELMGQPKVIHHYTLPKTIR